MNTSPNRGPTAGRVIALVAGSFAILIALALIVPGLAMVVIDRTQRDADGYFMSGTDRYTTRGYALTTRELTISSEVPGWVLDRMGKVRIEATPSAGASVFVGIAPRSDVDAYLADVQQDVVKGVHANPFRVDYQPLAGSRAPTAPAAQSFWVASTSGARAQRLTWDVRSGTWSVVVMNATATPGVSVDARIGANTGLLLGVGIGLLGAGILVLALGITFVAVGARAGRAPLMSQPGGLPDHGYPYQAGPTHTFASQQPYGTSDARAGGVEVPPAAAPTPSGEYPVTLDGRLDNPNRWLWLVKWFLLIPHYILLAVLWIAFAVLTAVALVAIVVTGRYPRGIFDFNVGVLRWTWRVAFYGYSALGTDRYPPFSLAEEPDYPATLTVTYPERLSRGLALVKWWLLAIPQYLVVAILGGGGAVAGWSGGLVGLLVLIAAILLLATNVYPRDVFRLVVAFNRWVIRVVAYAALMRDEYPPFRLDMDPPAAPAPRQGPALPPRPLGHGTAS